MALPLRFCCFFSPRHSQPKIRLAKFSVSSIKAKRKISGFFSKELPAVMAIPNNKLFVWRQHDLAQTSCSAKTNERFLQFALELTSTDGKESKRVYLKRPYDDTFLDFKNRLQQKVWDFLKELSKDKTSIIVQPIFSDGHSPEAVDDVGLFKLFFNTDEPNRQCSTLRIDQTNYEVVRDPAWLDKVEISLLPLVGCPILPSCDWKYTTDNVRFHWYIAHERLQLKISLVNGQSFADRIRLEPSEWVHVHTGPYYSPTMDHFGKFLAVIVDFDNDGIVVGTVCPTPIASAEHKNELLEDKEELIFERRQKECGTKQLSGDSYRLISYNILANLYLNLKKLEQKDLFFPYCPKRFLEANYRYPLLLRELEGYNADLMFLQEVDFRLQKRFLVPFLHTKNYSAAFNCKGNEVNEGLLIAFHNDRFHAMGEGEEDNFTVKLSQFLAKDPANSDIRSYLAYRERLHKTISTRPTILQLIRLRAKHGGRDMLCANTHLYFDPAHEEVKIIQSLLCLRYIEKICARLSKDATEEQIQVIFAGDLNSTPDSRAVALIGGDQIHLEMKRDNQKDEMPGNDPMKIQSSFKYKLLSGSPAYTNFTRPDGYSKGFNGCLDYIWAYPPLRIEHIWPMPDHLLVTKYGALPSPIAPSDHLPILCDVRMDRGVKESEDDEQLLK